MRKKLASAAIICMIAIFGAGAETYRINVGEFSELEVNDNVNVVYSAVPDSAGYVVFDIRPEYASYVMAERTKGRLKIELDRTMTSFTGKVPTVYAYSSFLSKAENTKDSTLYVRTVSPGAKIDIELQGNGKIVARNLNAVDINLRLITGKGTIIASGKCNNLNIKNVGAGLIQADEVAAIDVKCQVTGTGTIGCAPQKTLNIRGLGSGKVYYKGSPQITISKLSTVKAIPLNSEPEAAAPATVEETPENETEAETPAEPEATSLLDLVEQPEAAPSRPAEEKDNERKPLRKVETEPAATQEI